MAEKHGITSSANSLLIAHGTDNATITLQSGTTPILDMVDGVGGSCHIKRVTQTEVMDSGTAFQDIDSLAPAGSMPIGVTAEVVTSIAGASLSLFTLGDGTDEELYGTGLKTDLATMIDSDDYTAHPSTHAFSGTLAYSVKAVAAAGVFSTGSLRVTMYYIDTTQA